MQKNKKSRLFYYILLSLNSKNEFNHPLSQPPLNLHLKVWSFMDTDTGNRISFTTKQEIGFIDSNVQLYPHPMKLDGNPLPWV